VTITTSGTLTSGTLVMTGTTGTTGTMTTGTGGAGVKVGKSHRDSFGGGVRAA